MRTNNCPNCGGAARIRHRLYGRASIFQVWIECGQCGARTRAFIDSQEPAWDTPGGRWAALAWNSGDITQAQEERK